MPFLIKGTGKPSSFPKELRKSTNNSKKSSRALKAFSELSESTRIVYERNSRDNICRVCGKKTIPAWKTCLDCDRIANGI